MDGTVMCGIRNRLLDPALSLAHNRGKTPGRRAVSSALPTGSGGRGTGLAAASPRGGREPRRVWRPRRGPYPRRGRRLPRGRHAVTGYRVTAAYVTCRSPSAAPAPPGVRYSGTIVPVAGFQRHRGAGSRARRQSHRRTAQIGRPLPESKAREPANPFRQRRPRLRRARPPAPAGTLSRPGGASPSGSRLVQAWHMRSRAPGSAPRPWCPPQPTGAALSCLPS